MPTTSRTPFARTLSSTFSLLIVVLSSSSLACKKEVTHDNGATKKPDKSSGATSDDGKPSASPEDVCNRLVDLFEGDPKTAADVRKKDMDSCLADLRASAKDDPDKYTCMATCALDPSTKTKQDTLDCHKHCETDIHKYCENTLADIDEGTQDSDTKYCEDKLKAARDAGKDRYVCTRACLDKAQAMEDIKPCFDKDCTKK